MSLVLVPTTSGARDRAAGQSCLATEREWCMLECPQSVRVLRAKSSFASQCSLTRAARCCLCSIPSGWSSARFLDPRSPLICCFMSQPRRKWGEVLVEMDLEVIYIQRCFESCLSVRALPFPITSLLRFPPLMHRHENDRAALSIECVIFFGRTHSLDS